MSRVWGSAGEVPKRADPLKRPETAQSPPPRWGVDFWFFEVTISDMELEQAQDPLPSEPNGHLWGLGSVALLVLLWAMVIVTGRRK